MATQISRPLEPLTEVNMVPVLPTGGYYVEKSATVSLKQVMALECHEPPPPTPNMPSSRDRNANPPETSTKVLISLTQIS